MRRCAWCNGRVRWDDPMPNAVQVNAETALPHQTEFIVGLWGEVKQGTMQGGACRQCYARLTGQPEPPPIRYGPDNCPPDGVVGLQADGRCDADTHPVCGICRLALYEGDGLLPIRLYPHDLDLPADDCKHLETLLAAGDKAGARAVCEMHGVPMPGVPQACPECHAIYRPRVLRRLQAQGLAPANMTPNRMGRSLLL